MNSMQVKDKLKSIIKDKNINFNIALRFYVFDRFIVRLSASEYKDNFIIKGGFLLSTLFGLENRNTIDIDSSLTGAELTEGNIIKIINSIINIDLHDNIEFNIKEIGPIREEDEYGGYRVHLLFKFENIREIIKIDIATGDPITPKKIEYKYKPILDDNYINIWTYNIETVIAEKLETILNKADLSSRMKDYYDIYLIYNKDWLNINKEHLKQAVKNTFSKRNYTNNIQYDLTVIKESNILKDKWKSYSRKYEYAKDITYEEIITCIESILQTLEYIV